MEANKSNNSVSEESKISSITVNSGSSEHYSLTKEWETVQHRYQVNQIIRQSTNTVVAKARHRVTKIKVAIKYIKINYENEYQSKKVLREVQLLRQLS